MKECRIRLKDGEKEMEMEFAYEKENELILVDGIFRFFEIDVDFEAVAEKQFRIHKMYAEYYGDPQNFRNAEGSAEQAECGEMDNFQETYDRIKNKANPIKVEEPSNPGIKVFNNAKVYRCNYKCPKCGKSGNRYIPSVDTKVRCHDCGNEMKAVQINKDFTQDERYNFFLAGLKAKRKG